MIRFSNVFKEYPRTGLALSDASFQVAKGEFVFLTGPSGAGKSTILKLLYIRRDRYYAEHFVFALHVHAFVFLLFTLMMLLPGAADVVLVFALLVYTWVALKRVYRQGWFRTTVKWWTLGFTYSFVLLFGLVGLAIVTLLLT